MRIDRFSSLDELPRKDRGSPSIVLAILAKKGRFSCFEIEGKLCRSIDYVLHQSGWVTITGQEYPWTMIELTDAGRSLLSGQERG